MMNKNKIFETAATLVVLFAAMTEPWVAVVLAAAGLLWLGVRARRGDSLGCISGAGFWKTLAVVFVAAFAASALAAYLTNRSFPDSSWHVDTTTFIAGVVAIAALLILNRCWRSDSLDNINVHRRAEKDIALKKVMELLADKTEIANDDVERALGVSDKTAERYLQELVERGQLVQEGSDGRFVKYRKV